MFSGIIVYEYCSCWMERLSLGQKL